MRRSRLDGNGYKASFPPTNWAAAGIPAFCISKMGDLTQSSGTYDRSAASRTSPAGALAARAAGASVMPSIIRVTFWGALAMGIRRWLVAVQFVPDSPLEREIR